MAGETRAELERRKRAKEQAAPIAPRDEVAQYAQSHTPEETQAMIAAMTRRGEPPAAEPQTDEGDPFAGLPSVNLPSVGEAQAASPPPVGGPVAGGGLVQDAESWMAQRQASGDYARDLQLQKDAEAYMRDRLQGGSIRATPREEWDENPPAGSIGGAIAGGIAGSKIPGPPLVKAIGGLAGAFAGAAGGQFIQGRIEKFVGAKTAPPDLEDELFRMRREGTINLMFEGGIRGTAYLVPKLAGLIPYATKEGLTAQANLERMTGVRNPFFTAAEMTDSRWVDIMNNMAEYSILGGGAIKDFKQNRDVFVTNMGRALVSRYGPAMSNEEVGRAVADMAKFNLESARAPAKFLYDSIESAAAPQYANAVDRVVVQKSKEAITEPAIKKMTVKRIEAKPAVEEATTQKEAFGDSLVTFLRNEGGIQDQGGEVSRFEIKGKPGQRGLIKDDGMTLDQARERAIEAGYLNEGDDINALLNAIDDESRGTPRYSASRGNEALQQDIYEQEFNAQFQEAIEAEPELRGLKVKTTMQNIQKGEQLKTMKVMVTQQENQIGGTRIDLTPIKEEFADLMRVSKVAGGLANKAMGNTIGRYLAEKPEMVSYPIAKAMRTELRVFRDMLKNTPEVAKNAPGIAKADKLYKSLTKQIRNGLEDDDPFLAQMWDEANLIEAGAHQQFNTAMIQELVRLADIKGGGAPEAVAEKVWNYKRVEELKRTRNALESQVSLDPALRGASTWTKMQALEAERMWNSAIQDAMVQDSRPIAEKFKQAFFGPNGEKIPMLKAGFDPQFVQDLRDFYQIVKQTEKKGQGTGSVLIQMAQGRYLAEGAFAAFAVAASAVGLAKDVDVTNIIGGAGAVILLSPPILAKIMTSPRGIKLLTSGMQTPTKSIAGAQIGMQLLRIIQGMEPREAPTQTQPQAGTMTQPTAQPNYQ